MESPQIPTTCASKPVDSLVYISYRLAMNRHNQRGVSRASPVWDSGAEIWDAGAKAWDTGAKTWDAGAVTQTKGRGCRCLEKS
jgi:hypothetical protein